MSLGTSSQSHEPLLCDIWEPPEHVPRTGAAIIFKGSGFYETDYRSESYKTAAKADEAPKEAAKTDAAKTPAKDGATPTAPAKTESKSPKSKS